MIQLSHVAFNSYVNRYFDQQKLKVWRLDATLLFILKFHLLFENFIIIKPRHVAKRFIKWLWR